MWLSEPRCHHTVWCCGLGDIKPYCISVGYLQSQPVTLYTTYGPLSITYDLIQSRYFYNLVSKIKRLKIQRITPHNIICLLAWYFKDAHFYTEISVSIFLTPF